MLREQQGPGSPEWIKAFHNVKARAPVPRSGSLACGTPWVHWVPPACSGNCSTGTSIKYHNVGLMNSPIQNAFHALAIDERRKPFAPDLWTKPAAWSGTARAGMVRGSALERRWQLFPDGLANEALHWIVEKAEKLGLEFDRPYLAHYLPCFNSVLNDSMTAVYRLMGPMYGSSASRERMVRRCISRRSIEGASPNVSTRPRTWRQC